MDISAASICHVGCNQWPPTMMDAPSNVPADRKEIDPWTSSLLDVDVPTAYRLVGERLKSDDPKLAPLVKRMAGFVPIQVAFASERGHVRCVRQYMDAKSNMLQYDAIYIARPPAKEIIQKRLEFFDESLRSTMSEFLERFAGSGEEIEMAGQFAYDHWPTAKEFGYAEESSLGDWKEATLLYHAMNGDAVFIKPNGATAWRYWKLTRPFHSQRPFPNLSNCMRTSVVRTKPLILGLIANSKKAEPSHEPRSPIARLVTSIPTSATGLWPPFCRGDV